MKTLKYISLLSSSYSGSTLLSTLLSLPGTGIVSFGDTYPIPGRLYDENCTCGEKITDCVFRKLLESKMHAVSYDNYSWINSSPFPGHRLLSRIGIGKSVFPLYVLMPVSVREILFSSYFGENQCMLDCIQEITNCTHYLDGCKSLVRTELLNTKYDDFKIIHLIKDPRAYIYSVIRRNNRKNINKVLNNWIDYNTKAYSFREKVGPENYHQINFEELILNTRQSLNNLLSGIGKDINFSLPADDIDISDLHIIGNKMRLSFKHIENRNDEWRHHLDPDTIDYINKRIMDIKWLDYTLS